MHGLKFVSTLDLPGVFREKMNPVTVAGWVQTRRDHGGLIFIDLRDFDDIVQLVFKPQNKELFKVAEQLRDEWTLEISGQLVARDKNLQNPKLKTGKLEIVVEKMRILSQSKTLPININEKNHLANEEKRLTYRYLDLRRPKMQENLKLRANFYRFLRNFMEKENFIEIPTPILANSSPEGARDFLVPSRLHTGKFYALPQAPQQFKQLLMVGGVSRYYQIAACFRDEDPRADRLYGDFYQLDLEMSFVEDGEIVRQTFNPLIKDLITKFAGLKLYENKIRTLTYKQAIEDYGSDKPDLRFDLRLKDITSIFKQTKIAIFQKILENKGLIKGLLAPAVFSRKQIEDLQNLAKNYGVNGLAYLSWHNDEWHSPLLKFFNQKELNDLKNKFSVQQGQTIFWIADTDYKIVHQALGALRSYLGETLNLKDNQSVAALWIIDFPFYEKDESTGQLDFAHNPFSKPKGDLKKADPLTIVADQYDLVLNGYEVCSGAVRNHNAQQLLLAFAKLGYDLKAIKTQFKALLTAFEYGPPPHAGCAFGLDRILMILAQETNIRELVAFPKNGSGIDLMMGSPSFISQQQRKELKL